MKDFEPTTIYRSAIWTIFLQIATVFWSLTLLRRVYTLFAETPWIPLSNSTIVGSTVVLLAISLAIAWWFRLDLSHQTIKGPNLWGGFTTIPLTGRLSHEIVGIPGFQYLKIYGTDQQTIWLSLPVNDQTELFSRLSMNHEDNA